MLLFFIYILFVHWIADFVCQSRWMADGKSKRLGPLFAHVCVYASVLFVGLIGFEDAFKYAVFNGLIHLMIDFITSRASSFFFQRKNIYATFVVIGFDQFLHALSLAITLP